MLSVNHFEGVRLAYIKWLKADNELIEDAITGRKLNIVDQAQNIDGPTMSVVTERRM